MSFTSAQDMANNLPRRAALRWHLQYNHFPPIPLDLLDVAEQALDWYDDGDGLANEIALPGGILYRGHSYITVAEAFDSMHLYAFNDCEED